MLYLKQKNQMARYSIFYNSENPVKAVTAVRILIIVLGLCVSLWSQAETTLQQKSIKTAFVLNVAKFIVWPSDRFETPQAPFKLCYYRRDILGRAIAPFAHKRISGRRLKIQEVDRWPFPLAGCHLLLVADSELASYKLEAKDFYTESVLVVADLTDNPRTGIAHDNVHIALVRKGKRIGFEIHLAELLKDNLRASSELLKLARIVGDRF